MKPTKNRIYCPACNFTKMLFATKHEATRFLDFNADEIELQSGIRPLRAYHCSSCGGWHVTSKPLNLENFYANKFGVQQGAQIFNEVKSITQLKYSIREGLNSKIKQLRHSLHFHTIDIPKCQALIDELLHNFETVMTNQLETPYSLNQLFEKFSSLCSLFILKKEAQAIYA